MTAVVVPIVVPPVVHVVGADDWGPNTLNAIVPVGLYPPDRAEEIDVALRANGGGPIDPAASPRWAVRGRIVTADASSTVLMDGVVWIADAAIAAIAPAGDPAPAGFDGVLPLDTGGTVVPGLIELHNHTPYNVLPLWQVPQRYTNREAWGNSAEYHQLVTAPMKTIGEATELLPALVRYVDCKALVGGVTTTQGIALFSAPDVRRYYRGIVRNV